LLQASWASNEQQARQGLIASEEAERVRNRITAGALGLIDEIESGASAPKAVLEGLQKQFLSEQVTAVMQGGNVTNLSGSTIQVQGSQDVVIGSGNTVTKKTYTALGRRQFVGIAAGLLMLVLGGYFAFDLLRDRQEDTYVSLLEIRAELKMRSELDAGVRSRLENSAATLERWLTDGMNAFQRKEYPAAVENLEKVAAEVPLATVHQNLSYAYRQLGNAEKADANLETARQINPNLRRSSSGQVAFDLDGAWNSPEWGEMILVQNGNNITGAYTHDKGQIKGIIREDRMEFQWWELVDEGQPYETASLRQRGDGYFVISDDGTEAKINGVWRYEGDADWKGKWTAAKK
jgi:tetratricopeptide (TPR) repeat protein